MNLNDFECKHGKQLICTGKISLKEFILNDPLYEHIKGIIKGNSLIETYNKYFKEKIEPKMGDGVDIYFYDDIGVLCGSKGYLVVENNQIVEQLVLIRS